MFGIILPIASSCWTGPPTNGNNPCYSEHPGFPNGHRYAAMVTKAVAGTYNIFILLSYDWGQTWEEEQITFKTGGSATGYQYVGSICADLEGTGLHATWYGLGYHSHPHKKYYPSEEYVYSILYKYRDASGVWSPALCTPYEHDATLSVVEYGGDHVYAIGYPAFRYMDNYHPSMDIDPSCGDVHLVYSHWSGFNSAFRNAWYSTYYRKLEVSTGAWGELAIFRYVYSSGAAPTMYRPNLQVDTYGNPQITSTIRRPVSGWGPDSNTTCWFMNPNKGDYLSWPGTHATWDLHTLIGSFPVASPYAKLLFETPVSSGTPSYYSRMALSNFYTEGTFDYPHCIYEAHHSGYDYGVFHKYMDALGWHTDKVNGMWYCPYPSIAIGPDGMIYTLSMQSGTGLLRYSKKAIITDPWSDTETITGISSARQIHQRLPVPYPRDGQDCSPFMGMVGSTAKLFRCGYPATSGYGFFM